MAYQWKTLIASGKGQNYYTNIEASSRQEAEAKAKAMNPGSRVNVIGSAPPSGPNAADESLRRAREAWVNKSAARQEKWRSNSNFANNGRSGSSPNAINGESRVVNTGPQPNPNTVVRQADNDINLVEAPLGLAILAAGVVVGALIVIAQLSPVILSAGGLYAANKWTKDKKRIVWIASCIAMPVLGFVGPMFIMKKLAYDGCSRAPQLSQSVSLEAREAMGNGPALNNTMWNDIMGWSCPNKTFPRPGKCVDGICNFPANGKWTQ
jgi:hypothetical protein